MTLMETATPNYLLLEQSNAKAQPRLSYFPTSINNSEAHNGTALFRDTYCPESDVQVFLLESGPSLALPLSPHTSQSRP